MIKPTEEKKIFVYGSLREGFFNYDKYLLGKVTTCDQGMVKGKLYHLSHKGYPALVDGDDNIMGEIMDMKNFPLDIISLDNMEGYVSNEDTSQNEYTRTVIDVYNLNTDKFENCYVYKYEENNDIDFTLNSDYISHGDWKKYMQSK